MTDWPVKTLGELFEFKNGRGFKKTEWSTSGLPIIRIQNLNSDSASYNYFSGTFDEGILVEHGDLLFSWSGSIGTSFGPHIWRRSSGLLNQHIFKVSPKVPIDTDYAHYCLRVITAEIERSVNGAVGLVHITKEKLNKFEIPVPPLDEQKRIVALLDAATARVTELTACYEKARTHANNLFTSALSSALEGNPDWPVKTLGEMLELSYGKPLDARDRDDNGLIPVYGANGVKAYSKKLLVAGPSIIVGRKGSAGELNFCQGPFWPLDVTYYVEHNANKTDLSFLHYLLSLMNLPSLAKGVKPGINRNDVYALQATEPPLDEQKKIVARLDSMKAKTSEMVAAYDAKLTAAKNLRQSILEAAFAGDL